MQQELREAGLGIFEVAIYSGMQVPQQAGFTVQAQRSLKVSELSANPKIYTMHRAVLDRQNTL